MKTLEELIGLARMQANSCDAGSETWFQILDCLNELNTRRKADEEKQRCLEKLIIK